MPLPPEPPPATEAMINAALAPGGRRRWSYITRAACAEIWRCMELKRRQEEDSRRDNRP